MPARPSPRLKGSYHPIWSGVGAESRKPEGVGFLLGRDGVSTFGWGRLWLHFWVLVSLFPRYALLLEAGSALEGLQLPC